MRELNIEELDVVCGGNCEHESSSDTVKNNAHTAVAVGGSGNVKSVSTEGF